MPTCCSMPRCHRWTRPWQRRTPQPYLMAELRDAKGDVIPGFERDKFVIWDGTANPGRDIKVDTTDMPLMWNGDRVAASDVCPPRRLHRWPGHRSGCGLRCRSAGGGRAFGSHFGDVPRSRPRTPVCRRDWSIRSDPCACRRVPRCRRRSGCSASARCGCRGCPGCDW
jgi:hypothetical protein